VSETAVGATYEFAMPGLVPGIHVLDPWSKKDVDGRDEPGHDEIERASRLVLLRVEQRHRRIHDHFDQADAVMRKAALKRGRKFG
jgi:hypothetical protein